MGARFLVEWSTEEGGGRAVDVSGGGGWDEGWEKRRKTFSLCDPVKWTCT